VVGTNTSLDLAARAFVNGKYEFDAQLLLNGLVPKGLPRILSVWPSMFVEAALPFCDIAHSMVGETLEAVDPFLVVGGTYNDYLGDEEPDLAKIERLDRAAEDFYLGRPGCNVARYCKVGDLPLYVACEGKNRVLMYRRANRPVKAMITRRPYPGADDLLLHLIKPHNIYALRCLSPDYMDRFEQSHGKRRSISLLPFPDLAVPLLKSYGVRQGRNLYHLMARRSLAVKVRRLTGRFSLME
jgi:hypothetical protein